jgi:nucleoside-diphosphate-sugar epimerase
MSTSAVTSGNGKATVEKVAVIGGNGRVGRDLVQRLAARRDLAIVSIGRKDPSSAMAANVEFARSESLDDIGDAICDAHYVVNCASITLNKPIYTRHSDHLQRVIIVSSTRSLTALSDPHAQSIREAEAEFASSGLPGVVIRPSMVYGGGDKNVSRMAYYLTKTPIVPLPDDGRALIQPVHYQDVAASIEAAMFHPQACGEPIVVAGPQALTIRLLVETVAEALGRKVRILSVPSQVIHIAAAATRAIPGFPSVSRFQVERMLEDRSFDITAMRSRLGIAPRPFAIDEHDRSYWREFIK